MSKVFLAKANGYTKKQVLKYLMLDQYQTRTSLYPIILTNPRTGKQKVLSEYIEEVDEGSRFAIECEDKVLIFVTRLRNSAAGYIFLAVGEGKFRYDG